MRDRRNEDGFPAIVRDDREHDGAGAVLYPFDLSLTVLFMPEVRIGDNEAGVRVGQRHEALLPFEFGVEMLVAGRHFRSFDRVDDFVGKFLGQQYAPVQFLQSPIFLGRQDNHMFAPMFGDGHRAPQGHVLILADIFLEFYLQCDRSCK